MNKENLDKIINNYIQDISNIYNEEHDELFKWRAVKHFKDNWNIECDNFAEMLKAATSETSVFVNNNTVQPLNGLIKVAEKEPQAVKEIFQKLDDCNSKSIKERHLIVEECLKFANDKVKEYFGDSWKYKQEKRTIIFYMTLLNPDDNYFYKSTEAMDMARCIGYDDLSTGSNFRLESYYAMCEQIKEHIKQNKELLKIHNSYLTDKCWNDKNLNLLVFNIIYSSNTYGYYQKSAIDLSNKKLKTKDKKIKDSLSRKEVLENELIALRKEYADIQDYLNNLDEIFEIGLEINHIKFGNGKIIKQVENIIEVELDNKEIKKFSIPMSFIGIKPIITTSNTDIINQCKELDKKQNEKKDLERKIKLLEFQINELNKIITIK